MDHNNHPLSIAEWESSQLNYSFENRLDYISKIAFPIITKEITDRLVEVIGGRSVIEVGAGKGFLAKVLQDRGIKVFPIDNFESEYSFGNNRSEGGSFTEIANIDAKTLSLEGYDIVLMTWPDYDTDFASTIARNMCKGQILIYQGEACGGCTGDDEFFHILESNFKTDRIASNKLNSIHVNFMSIYDIWSVYMKYS